jgi:uncharacterized membrane protein YqhA
MDAAAMGTAAPHHLHASRWLQLPLYLGLIAGAGVYVFTSGSSWCT